MKFGLMAPYVQAPVEDGAYTRDFARLAEGLGFESVWAVDHVVMCPDYASRYPYDPSGRSPFHEDVIQPDPLAWLGFAGAATERLRLGTGILILPLRNPVVLAKTVASLDRLSGGRLLLGIGVGWVAEEAEAVGTDFASRGRRTDEAIEAMRALWRGEPTASFTGETVRFRNVVSRPKPVRAEGVPIVVGGHSRAAARRAGRLGDGFYPLGVYGAALDALLDEMRDAARASGRDPHAIEITTAASLDPSVTEAYAAQGVDRILVSPPTGDLDELPRALERFRRDVMEPHGAT
jgi:probable F420-dependent oxidoreductase